MCDKVVCERWCVCDKVVCERWCVTKLRVTKLCVCVTRLCGCMADCVCDKVVCATMLRQSCMCVCDKAACDKVVCVTKLRVCDRWCVTKLCATMLCVTKLCDVCDKVVCEGQGGRAKEEADRIQNQNQEPHAERCGKKHQQKGFLLEVCFPSQRPYGTHTHRHGSDKSPCPCNASCSTLQLPENMQDHPARPCIAQRASFHT